MLCSSNESKYNKHTRLLCCLWIIVPFYSRLPAEKASQTNEGDQLDSAPTAPAKYWKAMVWAAKPEIPNP